MTNQMSTNRRYSGNDTDSTQTPHISFNLKLIYPLIEKKRLGNS